MTTTPEPEPHPSHIWHLPIWGTRYVDGHQDWQRGCQNCDAMRWTMRSSTHCIVQQTPDAYQPCPNPPPPSPTGRGPAYEPNPAVA